MPEKFNGTGIEDVELIGLEDHIDDRGQFTEWFHTEWFPQCNWNKIQSNCSQSKAYVLRGLHYHFNQSDYWYVPHGLIMVVLHDLRTNSPTEGNSWNGFMGEKTPMGLYIPEGVAHGFYCVNDATLFYVVNNYFDGSDEHGVNWKDPKFESLFNLDNPVVSERDDSAPYLDQIKLLKPEYHQGVVEWTNN